MNELRDTQDEVATRPSLHILFEGMARVYDHAEADELFESLEAQLKASLAANREQKAEIERLHQKDMTYFYGVMAHEQYRKDVEVQNARYEQCIDSMESELASLRASVGEKWIDVKQELPGYGQLCIMFGNGVVQHALYSLDDVSGDWTPFDEDFDNAPFNTFTHWQPLPAPPTLPGEEK